MTKVVLLCRLLVAGVFIYAALAKIADPAGFAKAVYGYQILPVKASNVLAVTLPWIELLAGLALLLVWSEGRRGWVAEGSLVVTGLLVVFIVAISVNLNRGVDISCGCFGTSPEGRRLGFSTLVQDVALLLMSLVVLRGTLRAGGSSR